MFTISQDSRDLSKSWKENEYQKLSSCTQFHQSNLFMEGQSEKIKAVNAKNMATQTILSHSCRTPDKPEHDDCPSGQKSCDLTNGTNCHYPVKKPIPDAVVQVLQPLFDEIFW